MKHLAKKEENFQPYLEYGVVQAEGEGAFTVQATFGQASAERAFGCVVKPQIADTVLLSMDQDGNAFILSVLRREDRRQRTELSFTGDVGFTVRKGNLTLFSENRMAIATGKINIHAENGEAVIEKFSFAGKVFKGRIKRILVVANSVEHIFRRFTQRLQDAFRFVKDHEEVQTGNTRYLVEDTLSLHAKNANHMAEELVTINAEQIHLG